MRSRRRRPCPRRTAHGALPPTAQLRRWAIAAVSIAATLGPVVVTNADAGTYVIDDCPSAGNGNAGPWTVFGESQNTKGTCSGGLGDWIGPEGANMPPTGGGDLAGVQVAVPAGSAITIRGARLWWYVPHQVSGATTYAIAAVNTGQVGGGNTPLERGVNPEVLVFPSTTTELTLADYCSNSDEGNGCTFGGGENPNLELFGASLRLFDPGLPSGSVTGGSLAGSGPASGTESLAYNASDGGSGVRYVELLLDGKSVAKNDYIAECPYQNFAACPPNVSGTISWNTGSVAGGQHEMALRVVNAAGNGLIVDDHLITITNKPVQTSSGSISGAGIANGQSPCAGEALELSVNGKRKPPIIAYGKAVTVKGVLHCGTVPIRGARVLIATLGGPASAAINSSVTTALDGSFSYKVPTGPDRTLEFSYTAYSNDPGPSATATAAIMIRPMIKLRIKPHHSSNGHTIHWTGTVTGGPYPQQGVTLDVEVREGRGWKIFDQVVANRNGWFRYSYRFHATNESTTYRFRVALPDSGSGSYPYTPSGASNTVQVRVTP
jgi:hypothetical protein